VVQRLGLEWLWRLGQEPVRLFTRYVIGNPLFIWRVLTLQRTGKRL
jgi:UDP-N-acetyl-D-mannosaminuronic acid transferase (WecB/TagA/CpsF family)